MSRPDVLISYAQNHEDIVLARIFEPWKRKGHWIDVGAGHPTFDSVTKLFSDFGWSGINVEPLKDEYNLLTEARENDVNINCAIGKDFGTALLFEGPPESRGTSSLLKNYAMRDSESDHFPAGIPIEVMPLSAVIELAPWPVDFIKIDVEGMEHEVIISADWNQSDVDVVIVESTRPNSTLPSHEEWEPILLDAGYSFRMFDGLNRFYSREPQIDLVAGRAVSRWYPATAQDSFMPIKTGLLQAANDSLALEIRHLKGATNSASELISSLNALVSARDQEIAHAVTFIETLKNEIDKLSNAYTASIAEQTNLNDLISDLRLQVEALRTRIEVISQ